MYRKRDWQHKHQHIHDTCRHLPTCQSRHFQFPFDECSFVSYHRSYCTWSHNTLEIRWWPEDKFDGAMKIISRYLVTWYRWINKLYVRGGFSARVMNVLVIERVMSGRKKRIAVAWKQGLCVRDCGRFWAMIYNLFYQFQCLMSYDKYYRSTTFRMIMFLFPLFL